MQLGHFYLVASLPFLQFGAKPVITSGQFIEACEKWLSVKEMGVLTGADKNNIETGSQNEGIVRSWKEYNSELSEAVVLARKEWAQSQPQTGNPRIKQMFDAQTPLEIETAFEKKRWGYLDELECGHDFDVEFLTVYYLKLQILERLNLFVKEEGEQAFNKLCEVSHA